MSSSLRVLYIVYWGALEPLGQSLVVPAVLRLGRMGIKLSLVTFEKAEDLQDTERMLEARLIFENGGIEWHPLRYHKTPKWPATIFDVLAAVTTALVLSLRDNFKVIHARTFVAGPMGYLIARLTGARFVYHNEGFYPDEQVDGGVWRMGSLVHRVAKKVETFLYAHADGLIVLSERARAALRSQIGDAVVATPIVVAPSAVDLDAFAPPVSPAGATPLSLIYLGSVGLRYRLDDAGRFVMAMRKTRPDVHLTVVSRAERTLVESMLDSADLPRDAWTLKKLAHGDVPAELRHHHAGLFFLTEGLSEHGCSPTKVGEYWASGLPVVTTPNAGDTEAIVREYRVGLVVHPSDPASFAKSAIDLVALLNDPDLPHRCVRAAHMAYALEASCARQMDLYLELSA